jgi:hypothetical protein
MLEFVGRIKDSFNLLLLDFLITVVGALEAHGRGEAGGWGGDIEC